MSKKQFKCPECSNIMSSVELDCTWDWAGPHCSKCGCTSILMFTEVNKYNLFTRSKEFLLHSFEKMINIYDLILETPQQLEVG